MRKTPLEILKEIFPALAIAVLIPTLLKFFLGLAGLGLDAFLVPVDSGEVATMDPAGMSVFNFLPKPSFTLLGISGLVASIISYVVTVFLEAGASLAIYRKVKYDSDIKVEDVFYFFSKNIFTSLGTYILVGILITVALLVFVIPGIVVSFGLFTLPVVLGIALEEGRGNPVQIIKDSWASTKGSKGMIFGKLLLFAVVILIINLATTFFVKMGLGYEALLDPQSTANVLIIPLTATVLAIFSGIIMFIPEIDIYQELVAKKAFDKEDYEEDYPDPDPVSIGEEPEKGEDHLGQSPEDSQDQDL